MNKLENFFAESRQRVNQQLNTLVPNVETAPQTLHEAVRWSLFAGGKRFRPTLVFAVGQTFGRNTDKLLSAAAAIEMIHTYSLIHDDLPAMDDDDLRRGRATCHKKYGEATAILAGDVLQTLAFQTIAGDESLTSETRVKLISELAKAAGTPAGMVAGQQLDLDAESKKISVRELKIIHQSKTGAIICAAARGGAIIAEAGIADLKAITEYAAHLGLLFQITDDLLDATQMTETLGKTAGKDARANKATYVSLYGLDKAREMARKTHAEACEALEKINGDTDLLRKLIGFILNRKS